MPLDGDHSAIDAAVIIVIHDVSRDASSNYAVWSMMTALAGGANETTMIIAPQFLLESDIAGFADHLPNEGREGIARWAWRVGRWRR